MQYREFKPSPRLADHIECFWTAGGAQTDFASAPVQRILPDGFIELIFHLGDRVSRRSKNATWELQPVGFVSGQIRRFILIEPTGSYESFGVRFRPGMFSLFIEPPLDELSELSLELGDIWGLAGRELTARVVQAESHRRRKEIVEAFLIRYGKPNDELLRMVKVALAVIINHEGRLTIEALVRHLGCSSRQLERDFNRTVGLSPKVFSRIVRFQKVFRIMNSCPPPSLTSLALECGYYDQAHFIKEFRVFSGLKPSLYFSSPHPMTDYFTSKDRLSNFYNSVST